MDKPLPRTDEVGVRHRDREVVHGLGMGRGAHLADAAGSTVRIGQSVTYLKVASLQPGIAHVEGMLRGRHKKVWPDPDGHYGRVDVGGCRGDSVVASGFQRRVVRKH